MPRFRFLGTHAGMCVILALLVGGGLLCSGFGYPWGDGVVFSVVSVAFSVLPRCPRLRFESRVIFLSCLLVEGAVASKYGVRSGQIVLDGALAVLLVIIVERFARARQAPLVEG
jgi:hypothetical protein